jgi:hypothetical protein
MSHRLPQGFLGLVPLPRRLKAGSVVAGPPGPFFESIIGASRQVELYDEELDREPFRRGISTEFVAPGKAAAAFRSFRRRGVFALFAGYHPEQILPKQEPGEDILFLSPRPPENEKKRWSPSLTAGVRAGRSGGAHAPPVLTARMIVTGEGRGRVKRFPPSSLLIVDPLVMDPSLFPVPDNLEPGGLPWYELTALLRKIFTDCRPGATLLLPCRLARRDPVAPFVLARLMAKIIAYAACIADGA